jgi:hypothetical protein
MSNYSKLTNFASKDSLASGNPLKVIKGTEIDDEFEAIETAVGTKADLASPTFTGTPTAPTASAGTSSTQIATTAFVDANYVSNTDLTTELADYATSTELATHEALRSSQTVFGHAKMYVSGGSLYIETE